LEIYGVEVSPALVSQVTDAVCADVLVWQTRPLAQVRQSRWQSRVFSRQPELISWGFHIPTGQNAL
jgi:hypothetical protein